MTIPGLHDVFCIKIVFQWLIYCRVVNINSVYSYMKSHSSLVTLYIEFIQNNYGLLLNLLLIFLPSLDQHYQPMIPLTEGR